MKKRFLLFFVLVFIFHSAHSECLNNRPTTLDDQLDSIEQVFEHSELRLLQNEYCRQHENEFRQFVIERVEGQADLWRTYSQAPEVVEQIKVHIRELNQNFHEIYQNKANQWVASLSGHERQMALNCFIPQENHESAPYEFQFRETVHRLSVQGHLNETLCTGIHHSWEVYVGQTRDDQDLLQQFQDSPFARMLDLSVLTASGLNDAEMDRIVHSQINRGLAQMEAVKNRLVGLSDSDLFEVYDFQNLYEEAFLSGLDERERNSYFPTCRDNSSWASSCSSFIDPRLGDLSRCVTRSIDFLGEMVPLYGFIDGFISSENIQAAWRSGILTGEERAQFQTEAALQIVFNVPITLGSGVIARTTALGMAEHALSARVLRESVEQVQEEALEQTRRQLVEEAREEFAEEVTEEVVEETTEELISAEAIIAHFGSRSDSLTLSGSRRLIAGLDADLVITPDLYRHMQVHAMELRDPQQVREVLNNIRTHSDNVQLRAMIDGFLARTNQNPLKDNASDTAVENFVSPMLRDFFGVPTERPAERVTSLFSEEMPLEYVLAQLQRNRDVRLTLLNDSPNLDHPGGVPYRFTIGDHQFITYICRRSDGCGPNGATPAPEGALMTLYPECGPDIMQLNSLQRIRRQFMQSRNSSSSLSETPVVSPPVSASSDVDITAGWNSGFLRQVSCH